MQVSIMKVLSQWSASMDSWAAAGWLTLLWHLGGPLAPGTRGGWCRHLHANLRRSWGPRPVNSHTHTHRLTHKRKKTSPPFSIRRSREVALNIFIGKHASWGVWFGIRPKSLGASVTVVTEQKSEIYAGGPHACHQLPLTYNIWVCPPLAPNWIFVFKFWVFFFSFFLHQSNKQGINISFISILTFHLMMESAFATVWAHHADDPTEWAETDSGSAPRCVQQLTPLSPRPDGSCTQICIHFPLISSEIAGQLHLLSNTV